MDNNPGNPMQNEPSEQNNNPQQQSPNPAPTVFVDEPKPYTGGDDFTKVPKYRKKWLTTTAYLPEYAVMLILLGVSLSAIISLIGVGLRSLSAAGAGDPYSELSMFGDLNQIQLLWSLSALIATLPVFAWLFVRTRNSESQMPEIKTHRWRRAFLGIFLIIQGLTIVASIGGLAYDMLSRVVADNSYLSTTGSEPVWIPILSTAISTALLTYIIYVMSRDYRTEKD